MLFQNKYLKWLGFSIIGISFLASLNIAFKRYNYEAKNQTVDLVVSLKEINKLANAGGMTRSKLLSQLAQEAGITSIAVEEDTLEDFISQGQATLLKGSEIMNMLRVGKVYRTILTNLSRKTRLRANKIYLIIDEYELYERIKNFLKISLEVGSVKERGWNILEITADEETLFEIGFGISSDHAKKLNAYGLGIIPRFKNNTLLSDALIKLKFSNLENIKNIQSIIFEGRSVLGYPSKLDLLAENLKKYNLNFGLIEFSKQKGAKRVAAKIPNSVIKVHSISEKEMETISKKDAITRYLRAAKERSNRILFLHPFMDFIGEKNIIAYNLEYFKTINNHLKDFKFDLNPVLTIPSATYVPAQNWELFLLSIGLFVWLLILINKFTPLKLLSLSISTGIFIIFFLILNFLSLGSIWNRITTTITATIFPVFAIIQCFPDINTSKNIKSRSLESLLYLIKLVGICLIGALLIIGFTSDITYLLSIKQFFGVKISFILPLILIGLYFYLRPHRISSIYYVLKRLFFAQITTGAFIAVLLCLAIIAIYILRSGNYLNIHFIETWMRNSIESLLFVRPRTKEFLIGFPFLLIAYIYIDTKISRTWLWFFNVLGSVALISIMNSFCHTHTPLTISIYRTFLGLLLGLLFGWVYIYFYRISKLIFKKLSG